MTIEPDIRHQSRPTLVLSKPLSEWTVSEIQGEIESGSQLSAARTLMLKTLGLKDLAPFDEWDTCRTEFIAIVEIAKSLGLVVLYGKESIE